MVSGVTKSLFATPICMFYSSTLRMEAACSSETLLPNCYTVSKTGKHNPFKFMVCRNIMCESGKCEGNGRWYFRVLWTKVKVKVMLSFPRLEGVHRNSGTAPLILNLCTRWRCVVSFTPRRLYPREKCRCPLNRRLVRYKNVCGRFARIRTPDHPVRALVTILTDLTRFTVVGQYSRIRSFFSFSNHDVSLSSVFFFLVCRGNVRYSTP